MEDDDDDDDDDADDDDDDDEVEGGDDESQRTATASYRLRSSWPCSQTPIIYIMTFNHSSHTISLSLLDERLVNLMTTVHHK